MGARSLKIIADHDIQRVFTAFEKAHELAPAGEGERRLQARQRRKQPLAAESFDLIGLGVALDRACPAWFGWSGSP